MANDESLINQLEKDSLRSLETQCHEMDPKSICSFIIELARMFDTHQILSNLEFPFQLLWPVSGDHFFHQQVTPMFFALNYWLIPVVFLVWNMMHSAIRFFSFYILHFYRVAVFFVIVELEPLDGKSHIPIQSYMDRRTGPLLTDILFDLQRQKYVFWFGSFHCASYKRFKIESEFVMRVNIFVNRFLSIFQHLTWSARQIFFFQFRRLEMHRNFNFTYFCVRAQKSFILMFCEL